MKNLVWLEYWGFNIKAILITCGCLFGFAGIAILVMYISYKVRNK